MAPPMFKEMENAHFSKNSFTFGEFKNEIYNNNICQALSISFSSRSSLA
jgi:hypothetical protein